MSCTRQRRRQAARSPRGRTPHIDKNFHAPAPEGRKRNAPGHRPPKIEGVANRRAQRKKTAARHAERSGRNELRNVSFS